ncbi:MAG: glycosyltransferase family 39 protein [Anaerolineae bacterium]|nr:MAG: glycosyltransferase family 39 protein [Anaerolineae bacterium]
MGGRTTESSSAEPDRTPGWAIPRWLSLAILAGILAIAAYLRLWGLEHAPTGGDQAVLLNIALRWVTQGRFPLAGNKSSIGLMNPPLLEYLLAIPLFLRRDMVWVAQFVALVNLASVALTYFILRVTLGLRVALLATLLYAVNPWSVYYARLIWNPTMVPLFSTLLLGSLLSAFIGRRKNLHLALIFLWLAGAIQLHLASVALIPAVGLLFWMVRHKLALRPLLVGTLLFLLTFLPFFIYEVETGFTDWADFRQATSGTIKANLAPVAIALELAGEKGIWHTMGAAWSQWQAAVAWGRVLGALTSWLLLAGLVVAGGRLLRRREEFRRRQFAPKMVGLIVTVTLFAVPLFFYVRHTAYLQNYYFLYLYPVPFVFMALPADAALSWAGALPRTWRRFFLPLAWLPVVLVVALAGWQFHLNHAGLRLLAENVLGKRQVWHVQGVIDTFADWGRRHPDCDLFVASDGYHAESSVLGQVGEFLAPRSVRYVRLGGGTIIPRTCGLYLVASDDPASRAWYEAQTTLLPERTIHLPHDAWHFYEMTPSARDALVETLEASSVLGQWKDGVQLRRFTLNGNHQSGSVLRLALTWEVYGTPPKKRYHFFNHLLDEGGSLVAQADGPGVFSRYWQQGEFFVTWFEIVLPADLATGIYRLAVGFYDWPSLERSLLTDGRDYLPLTSIEIR